MRYTRKKKELRRGVYGTSARTGFTPLKGLGTAAESRRTPGGGNEASMRLIKGPIGEAWSAAAVARRRYT
jgi:hypothetical protein